MYVGTVVASATRACEQSVRTAPTLRQHLDNYGLLHSHVAIAVGVWKAESVDGMWIAHRIGDLVEAEIERLEVRLNYV